MHAFSAAAPIADVLETDVRFTADRQIVLFHDRTVDRTALDATGPVSSYTLAELQALSYRKSGVPASLEELLVQHPEAAINIDLKEASASLVVALGEQIRAFGGEDRVVVGSFHPAALAEFRRRFPTVRTSLHPGEVKSLLIAAWTFRSYQNKGGGACAQIPVSHRWIPVTTRRLVRTAHAAHLEVHTWTVNDESALRWCLRCGVDAVMSDDPAWARAAVDRLSLSQ